MAGKAKIEAALRLRQRVYGFEVIKRILGWVGYRLLNIEKKGEIYYTTYIAVLYSVNTVESNYDALDMLNKSLKAYALAFGVEPELEAVSAKTLASHYKPYFGYLEYVARCYVKGEQPNTSEEFNKMRAEDEAKWQEIDKA